jgi:hypothetical protein
MMSEQRTELISGHADARQDLAQGSLGNILASVDRYGDRPAVGMAHDVMTTCDPRLRETRPLQRLDYPRPRCGRDRTRHTTASYQKSRNVERQGQLVRYPNIFYQSFQTDAQVADRRFLSWPVPERGNAGTELRSSTPNAVLILLDDIGHMNGAGHDTDYAAMEPASKQPAGEPASNAGWGAGFRLQPSRLEH